ncbi:MAG: helix-turn-helix domain-containing protein [Synergistaceae bacterium]|nr:helix-turn-helix domain-containing protein [Synergistaceae bacterium]
MLKIRDVEFAPQSIGANIKARRRALGLNQDDLADKLGLTQANISRIEGSPKGPSGEMLLAIATALGCDVNDLLGVVNAPGMEDLDDEAKSFVVNMLKSDPQFGMYLRSLVRECKNFAEDDWRFLASSIKLALGYVADAIKNKKHQSVEA